MSYFTNAMGNTENKYCIIGGGPSGLCTAKNLKDKNVSFDGYEAASEIGGLWNINNENSSVYETAHLISSKTMTEFKDFPMKQNTPDYPSHEKLFEYFKDYAEHFKLREHYTLNTYVTKLEQTEKGWDVTLSDGRTLPYKGVIIANGTLSEPNKIAFKGDFLGEIIHSKDYKSPTIFTGKRVLIVGAGNSGCDIAVDAVHHAAKVRMSVRRGYHFVPKYIFGKPADTVGGLIKFPKIIKQKMDKFLLGWFLVDPVKYGFPEPDHKLYESHPIVNSLILYYLGHGDIKIVAEIEKLEGNTVYFKDGTKDDYDLILTATGYILHYPFIDKKHLNWKDGRPELYLNIFHPEYNNLFFMGLVEATGLGWEGRNEQAKLIASFIAAYEKNAPSAQKFVVKKKNTMPDLRGGMNYIKLDRMAFYVHKDTYRHLVKTEIEQFAHA